ncbi:unnamed protein product [Phytomonas sp. Hart1]|nr:unnamed protein product [Phytomonas sp. Hart1]|eukprot:CCW71667.1 unnamed protein product [Phytomonas sp. isolate Hart1]
MGSSKVRKEEAELRQIAKRARGVRKEAKKRAASQKRREARGSAAAEGAKDVEVSLSSIRLRNRRNAVVLAGREVERLHQKLRLPKLSEAGDSTAAEPSRTSSTDSSAAGGYPTPNHHFEIHHKRKEVLVDVVLHHIPPQKIDLAGTTATRLVVDTSGHTKKYRLDLPMPEGLRVDHDKGAYEFENGVLHCRLPILNEDLPAGLQNEWEVIQDKIREQRALRFRVNAEGDLTVRMRRTVLGKPSASSPRLLPSQGDKRPREELPNQANTSEEESAIAAEASSESAKVPEAKSTSASSSGKAKKARAETPGKGAIDSAKSSPSPHPNNNNNNPKTNAKTDVFAEEHAKAMTIAKAVSEGVRHSIREKVQLAKKLQQKRLERVNVRSARQERRCLREAESFQRVLDEQKRQLMEQAALTGSAEATSRKKEQARKDTQRPSKSVSFKD